MFLIGGFVPMTSLAQSGPEDQVPLEEIRKHPTEAQLRMAFELGRQFQAMAEKQLQSQSGPPIPKAYVYDPTAPRHYYPPPYYYPPVYPYYPYPVLPRFYHWTPPAAEGTE